MRSEDDAQHRTVIDFADTARRGNSPMATRDGSVRCRRLLRSLVGLAVIQAIGAAIAIIVFLSVVGALK